MRGEQRQAVAVHPVRSDEHQITTGCGRPTRLSVTNADANSAYFDDAYLVDNAAKIDAAWQAWKGG